ncbi:MAG: RNA polymerase sigma factor [Calditrichaceae bacterium]
MTEKKSFEIVGKMSDTHLVQASLKDKDYFYHLMNRYEARLLIYINRITNVNKDEAADLLQEIFIKVYRNLNSFSQKLSFSSWIYRIARNEIINHYHKNNSRASITESFSTNEDVKVLNEIISPSPDSHSKYIEQECTRKINNALYKLPEKYREVLVLHYLENLSYDEISDILQKPAGTIASLINRGKSKFRKIAERQNINLVNYYDRP